MCPALSSPTGADNATCGLTPTSPCATVRYAVNGIGPSLVPSTSMLTVVMAPGVYGPASCGTYGLRPLTIVGAGSNATTVDCGGTNRFLFAFSVTVVRGMTITRGAVGVSGRGAGGIAVDGGGAIAIVWSASQTPRGK
jgi:hypothetical protein